MNSWGGIVHECEFWGSKDERVEMNGWRERKSESPPWEVKREKSTAANGAECESPRGDGIKNGLLQKVGGG